MPEHEAPEQMERSRGRDPRGAGRSHARGHIDAARAIIEETGYHRRDGELAELDVRLAEKG